MIYLFAASSIVVFACTAFFLASSRRRSKLAEKIDPLKIVAFELIGSSDQINAMSKDLDEASEEQLRSLSITSSASREIQSMTEATSQSAMQLDNEAIALREMADSGVNVLAKMVTSSEQIQQGAKISAGEMQESVNQLTQAVEVIREIAKKTQIINEIVFQTKLLSFNASVEAARAGEAGKGFAVVAEEVGKLAQMSGNAANEISQIVDHGLGVAQGAIDTTKVKISAFSEQIMQQSEVGFKDARECKTVFSQMVEKISDIVSRVSHISSAAKEQAIGVNQLDHSINSLQEVADRNRLVASQTSEYGREFEGQTKGLLESVRELSGLAGLTSKGQTKLQKFVWGERLMLGVSEMDEEHQILVGKINMLVTELELRDRNLGKERLLSAFRDLADYTVKHFSDEEKFMESIGYRQLESHKKIHQKLLEQVGRYGEELRAGTIDDQKLVSFLQNWLVSHIMGVDMQYANHYKSSRAA